MSSREALEGLPTINGGSLEPLARVHTNLLIAPTGVCTANSLTNLLPQAMASLTTAPQAFMQRMVCHQFHKSWPTKSIGGSLLTWGSSFQNFGWCQRMRTQPSLLHQPIDRGKWQISSHGCNAMPHIQAFLAVSSQRPFWSCWSTWYQSMQVANQCHHLYSVLHRKCPGDLVLWAVLGHYPLLEGVCFAVGSGPYDVGMGESHWDDSVGPSSQAGEANQNWAGASIRTGEPSVEP